MHSISAMNRPTRLSRRSVTRLLVQTERLKPGPQGQEERHHNQWGEGALELEVRRYLLLIELQPGSIEREPQNPTGVHQTPAFSLGGRHRGERDTPR